MHRVAGIEGNSAVPCGGGLRATSLWLKGDHGVAACNYCVGDRGSMDLIQGAVVLWLEGDRSLWLWLRVGVAHMWGWGDLGSSHPSVLQVRCSRQGWYSPIFIAFIFRRGWGCYYTICVQLEICMKWGMHDGSGGYYTHIIWGVQLCYTRSVVV